MLCRVNRTEAQLPFEDDIACDFAAGTERLLRFAVQLSFYSTGVAERQNELVLALPSGLFSRPE